MARVEKDITMVTGPPKEINTTQKIATVLGVAGLLILVLATFNVNFGNKALWLTLALGGIASGIILFAKGAYGDKQEGIKNDAVWFKGITSRGFMGWVAGISMTGFYVVLYFYAHLLGLNSEGENTGVIALFDPLSKFLSGNPASQWFVYGTLYTIAIVSFGIKFIWKYRHNKYERLRTFSVMFFQTGFAFIIPELMARLNTDSFKLPYIDLKSIWPLNYDNFAQYRIDEFIGAGGFGIALLIFGVASILIVTPIMTYKYGKRWYCSWVCGCGGLAETAGDSFRQLSDKSTMAWKVERWVVHSVIVFSVLMTTAVVYSYLQSGKYWLQPDFFLIGIALGLILIFGLVWIFRRDELKKDAKAGAIGYFVITLGLIGLHYSTQGKLFIFEAGTLQSTYGFLIGAVFSGVIGTGFYPIFGNRVWCRFGCPMAAIMGLQQRFFSKFRITTNGGQCISCGNCSTYCEMGIDVKAYAQKGQNIVRSSCVGCGVCSAVCPRGVLKLENGDDAGDSRYDSDPITFGNEGVKLNM